MIISPDSHLYVDGKYVWTRERAGDAWAKARQELGEALASPKFRKLVLMIGIPGSGKSTWIAANMWPDRIYFDACLCGDRERAEFIRAGKAAGKDVVGVWMDTELEECLRRNALRTPDRMVPEKEIRRMANKLERNLPSAQEGFSILRRIFT